jgi:hypothetical protein
VWYLYVPVITLICNETRTAVQRAAKDLVLVLTSRPYVESLVGAMFASLYATRDVPTIRCAFTATSDHKVSR